MRLGVRECLFQIHPTSPAGLKPAHLQAVRLPALRALIVGGLVLGLLVILVLHGNESDPWGWQQWSSGRCMIMPDLGLFV
jgi:hypothetical protein